MCDVHVGVFGAAEIQQRLPRVEAVLEGQVIDAGLITRASDVLAESVEPSEDIHATADYRRAMVKVMFERALLQSTDVCMSEAN
jgi:carbon-monoxide dehydrogenase medium subunit